MTADDRGRTKQDMAARLFSSALKFGSFLLLASTVFKLLLPLWTEAVPPIISLIVAAVALIALLVILAWPKDRPIASLLSLRASMKQVPRK